MPPENHVKIKRKFKQNFKIGIKFTIENFRIQIKKMNISARTDFTISSYMVLLLHKNKMNVKIVSCDLML